MTASARPLARCLVRRSAYRCAGIQITSNTLLPFARLNVRDGLNTFYNPPWARTHFAEPLLTEISNNVDVVEAWFEPAESERRFAVDARQDRSGDVEISISNVFERGRGAWKLYRDGVESASGDDERVARMADAATV